MRFVIIPTRLITNANRFVFFIMTSRTLAYKCPCFDVLIIIEIFPLNDEPMFRFCLIRTAMRAIEPLKK